MDKEELIVLLQSLDSSLTTSCDVLLVGGAAMIIHFGATRATRDVDAFMLRGDQNDFRAAVQSVAQDYNLADNWLNDAVKGFAPILPPDFYRRLTPLAFSFARLRLYVLGRPEQAAMKIVALREQDLEDLDLLLPPMTDDEKRILLAIIEHVAPFRADWAQRMQLFLEEQGWKLD